MTIPQRIKKYITASRSRSKLRSQSHEQNNDPIPPLPPANMTPKPQSSSDSRRDIDQELRPRKKFEAPSPATGVETSPENLMDNWFLSSQKSALQKGSDDRVLRNAWEARDRLPVDSSNGGSFGGKWEYSYEDSSRKWQKTWVDVPRYNIRAHSKSTNSNPALPAFKEDKEISKIYREFWAKKDKKGFVNKIYAKNNSMSEKTIWTIFRCLISELVPEDSKWKTIPPHIVAEPNTIWQAGKCMLHIVTRGRFWDDDKNVLNPQEGGEKFGHFKQNTLQKVFSKSLIKHILACLSVQEEDRPTKEELMNHFDVVFSIYSGTYKAPIADDEGDAPYSPTDDRIPKGLTIDEGKVYEKLISIVADRSKKDGTGVKKPHIITITDLAKDYDDLMAMMCLKELHRLGIVQLEGFVANLMPADRRALFGRGALDSMGLNNTPCAIGTFGDRDRVLVENSHEFDNTTAFMPEDSAKSQLPDGQELLQHVFGEAIKNNEKLTLLCISSLMDIALFAENHKDLLIDGLDHVVLQGGYRVVENKLVADEAAANNRFDMEGAQKFHDFIQHNQIFSTVWTKVATEAVSIYSSLFAFLEETGHPLGPYIRKVQVGQDLNFYQRACVGPPFAPHMTQDWYVKTKSTWFAAGHEPDESYPLGQDMVPYFTKVVAYDALAAVGAAGEDVLEAFNIIKDYTSRTDARHPDHRIVGVPAVKAEEDQPALPADKNLYGDMMGVVITALMKGSILAYQQKLKGTESS